MTDQNLVSDERAPALHNVGAVTADPTVEAPTDYGSRLAWQRQKAGLGVTDVAAQLRLHPNQVRAIEQEDLARLPAPAYVRGFVRSYARVLNIDPTPLLNDLNAKLEPREPAVNGESAEASIAPTARDRRWPQWMIAIALVTLIALGVVGWQATQQPAGSPPEPAVASAVSPAPPPPTATAAQTPAPAANDVAPAPAATEPVPAPTEVAEPTVAPNVMTSGAPPTLILRFNGSSWAEVTDRNGKILFSQLSATGAEHALDGELPLNVVIGDANVAAVEVRGAVFNLQPFMRNNVARFTVK